MNPLISWDPLFFFWPALLCVLATWDMDVHTSTWQKPKRMKLLDGTLMGFYLSRGR